MVSSFGDDDPTSAGDFTEDSFMRAVAAAPARPLPPATPAAGTVIGGRYVVRSLLGRGGMGVVVLADDPRLSRAVAIKLSGVDPRGAVAARMTREAKAMARVEHPHVLGVFDVGTHEAALFIAMEYAPGGSLRQWLALGPHPPDVIGRVFEEAGAGLAAAHAHGLVHRDFKPDNVLFDAEGRAKVADFGLVRGSADVTDDEGSITSLTATGTALGTPAYMPPEQYGGAPIDARADQFAFCVALWEALCGERPFGGTSAPEILLSIGERRLRPVPAGRRVSAAVVEVLRRGLSPNASDRFPSMPVLLGALRHATRPTANPRTGVLVAVGIMMALAGTAAAFALTRGGEPAEPNGPPPATDDAQAAQVASFAESTTEPSDPEIAALLARAEAARAQRYAGELDAAARELTAVVAELRRRRGSDDEVLVWPLAWLAEVHEAREEHVAAHALYVEALGILQRHRPPDDMDIAELRLEVMDQEVELRLPF